MPKRLPSRRTRSPVSMAACAARPPERSTGIVPVPRMNILTRKPLSPLPVKYSALATKVTFRFTISGMKIESENDRWLLAMIAGPWFGTFSRPSTCGRKIALSQGPRSTYLSRLYSTPVPSAAPTGARPPVGTEPTERVVPPTTDSRNGPGPWHHSTQAPAHRSALHTEPAGAGTEAWPGAARTQKTNAPRAATWEGAVSGAWRGAARTQKTNAPRAATWEGAVSEAWRGAARTQETNAPRAATWEGAVSGAWRGAFWTEERSDEGRRRTKAPRAATREEP